VAVMYLLGRGLALSGGWGRALSVISREDLGAGLCKCEGAKRDLIPEEVQCALSSAIASPSPTFFCFLIFETGSLTWSPDLLHRCSGRMG
jgi:hypothetical protein